MPPREKYASREARQKLREILLQEWDPIGVYGRGEADDEYDTYVGKVQAMLADGASESELVRYLILIERDWMGLDPNPARALSAVRSLLKLSWLAH